MTTLIIPTALLARLQQLVASYRIEPTADGYRAELRLEDVRSGLSFLKSFVLLPAIFGSLAGIAIIAQPFLPFWLFMCLVIPAGFAGLGLFLYALRRRWVVRVDAHAVTIGKVRVARSEFAGFKVARSYVETRGVSTEGAGGETVHLGVIAYENAGRLREMGALDVNEARSLVSDLNRPLSA